MDAWWRFQLRTHDTNQAVCVRMSVKINVTSLWTETDTSVTCANYLNYNEKAEIQKEGKFIMFNI